MRKTRKGEATLGFTHWDISLPAETHNDTHKDRSPSSNTLTEASILINLQLPDAVRNDRTRRDLQGNIAVHLDVVAVLHAHLRIHVQTRCYNNCWIMLNDVNYFLMLPEMITHTLTEFPRKFFSANMPPKLHCSFFLRLMVHELVVKILSFTTASSSARFCSCFTSLCCMSTCLIQTDAGRVSQ